MVFDACVMMEVVLASRAGERAMERFADKMLTAFPMSQHAYSTMRQPDWQH